MRPDMASLSRVPDATLVALGRWLGASAKVKAAAALQEIVGVIEDPEALASHVARLPEAAQRVLELLCATRGCMAARTLRTLCARLLGASVAQEGCTILEAYGLLYSSSDGRFDLGVRPLLQALQPLWRRRELGEALPVSGDANGLARLAFAVKVWIAHVAAAPVRLTRADTLHSRDQQTLQARFAACQVTQVTEAMRAIGVLTRSDDDTLMLRSSSLHNAERLDAGAWYVALHKDLLGSIVAQCIEFFLQRPGPHPQQQALDWITLACDSVVMPGQALMGVSANYCIDQCVERGVVERTQDAHGAVFLQLGPIAAAALAPARARASLLRLDSAPEPIAAACHLQGNFELLVPPEISLDTLLDLATFCDLQQCDTVATWHVSREGVQRAVASGRTVAWLIATLRRVCRFEVPSNVVRGIEDFARECRHAFIFEGLVVVPEAHAEFFHGVEDYLAPTRAPGTWRLVASRGGVCRKLKSLGFVVVEGIEPSRRRFDTRPPLIEQVRGALDKLVTAAELIEAAPLGVLDASAPDESDVGVAARQALVAAAEPRGDGPVLDADGVRAAMARGCDLWVWPTPQSKAVQVTPHAVFARGSETVVAGHVSGTYIDRLYSIDRMVIRLGPPTDSDDGDRRAI